MSPIIIEPSATPLAPPAVSAGDARARHERPMVTSEAA